VVLARGQKIATGWENVSTVGLSTPSLRCCGTVTGESATRQTQENLTIVHRSLKRTGGRKVSRRRPRVRGRGRNDSRKPGTSSPCRHFIGKKGDSCRRESSLGTGVWEHEVEHTAERVHKKSFKSTYMH